ncbi:putative YT521-B-like splicing factor [Aspergillus alliaceus]|uniref:putative YT521-B-like splicing factor n=1 Tax=Petromyces alliaceus TaxID=209559 RepID=UPI0012A46E43|nr:YT521-B-like domain-containing protein [Aspergillus alliaceus]KAB8232525.1 YT521-B-like domain-containing protein [Aspergillus alliaceus]
MTNSIENTAPAKSESANAAPGGSISHNSNKACPSATATQQTVIELLQDTRPQIVHHYPEQTTYIRHSGPGMPSATLGMRSTLPGYQTQTIVFGQRAMSQHIIPPSSGYEVVHSPMHSLPVYPETAPNMNMPFNNPFPQAYSPYLQHQHQHLPIQHSNPGYPPLGYNSPAHLRVPVVGYGQTYYTPPTYAASREQGVVQANVTIHFQPHGLSRNTKDNLARTSATLPEEPKPRSLDSEYDVSMTIVDGSTPMRSTQAQPSAFGTPREKSYEAGSTARGPPFFRDNDRLADPSALPINFLTLTTPRGPPRKPKQSGNALWIGNLPPATDINELKDYFAREATRDVESVFLISKSNCAFVNYKTEAACLAALSRFHDSRFHGARLVCRLRRGSMSPAPQSDSSSLSVVSSFQAENDADTMNEETINMPVRRIAESRDLNSRVPNRYFIVKSLSMDDLELSRQSGTWATQAHNENNLNQAYQTADNVYLFFSANKSGEYYGYARMVSPIQEGDGLNMEMPPRLSPTQTEPEDLDSTPTPATSTAPKGRIINDLARGTVFWEADSSEDEGRSKIKRSVADVAEEVAESGFQSIGKPFRIQWLSTERVPFHRTRGLRNPWNANREIKIARDGTEIEPAVGERLMQLFNTSYPG